MPRTYRQLELVERRTIFRRREGDAGLAEAGRVEPGQEGIALMRLPSV